MFGDADARPAADKAIDTDRLLPGEHRNTTHLEDARHWLAVYQELVKGKKWVITATNEAVDGMRHDEARGELEATDAIVLEHQLARFRRGLAFWLARTEQLSR